MPGYNSSSRSHAILGSRVGPFQGVRATHISTELPHCWVYGREGPHHPDTLGGSRRGSENGPRTPHSLFHLSPRRGQRTPRAPLSSSIFLLFILPRLLFEDLVLPLPVGEGVGSSGWTKSQEVGVVGRGLWSPLGVEAEDPLFRSFSFLAIWSWIKSFMIMKPAKEKNCCENAWIRSY